MNAQRKNLFTGVVLGTVAGVLLQLGGYLLVRGARSWFDCMMFRLVPFSIRVTRMDGCQPAPDATWPGRVE